MEVLHIQSEEITTEFFSPISQHRVYGELITH